MMATSTVAKEAPLRFENGKYELSVAHKGQDSMRFIVTQSGTQKEVYEFSTKTSYEQSLLKMRMSHNSAGIFKFLPTELSEVKLLDKSEIRSFSTSSLSEQIIKVVDAFKAHLDANSNGTTMDTRWEVDDRNRFLEGFKKAIGSTEVRNLLRGAEAATKA